MQLLHEAMRRVPEYETVRRAAEDGRFPIAASGLSHIHKANLIGTLRRDVGRRALVVVSDEAEAAKLGEDLTALGERVVIFPARDFTFREVSGLSREYEHARIGALSRIADGDYTVALCSADAALQYTLPPDVLCRARFTLRTAQSISPQETVRRLLACGYVRAEQVEGPGQFALRGGILDVFPPDLPSPARIEFWGDEIDSIARFDPVTQRRTESVQTLVLPPAVEVFFPSAEALAEKLEAHAAKLRKSPAAARAKEKLLDDARALREGRALHALDRYLPLAYDAPATVLDYAGDALLFFSETARLKERCRTYSWQLGEDVKALLEDGTLCAGLDDFALDWNGLVARAAQSDTLLLETFARGGYELPLRELVSFTLRQNSVWNGSVKLLLEDIAPALEQGFAVAVLAGTERAAVNLAEELRAAGVAAESRADAERAEPGRVLVCPGTLSSGLEYPQVKFLLVSAGQTGGRPAARRKRPKNANQINSLEELHPGDYVVHAAHGIGVFEGIHKLQVEGVTKDYIKIRYAKQDVLYVPVTQLDLVSKYIGNAESENLKLNRLGGSEWQKTRARVKSAVRDMAKELIRLYAARMNTRGYAFSPDTDFQSDFERRFEYEETEDQLRCAEEIKADMERPVPMDRLLCGDVGFGKTEVALRAAFKCIADGKQCALLVPTTILAWQHYQTILRRMEGLPVSVELLSRFRTPKQQEEILKRLNSGEIDLIVGTHRLVSKDVKFHDLGLVIVDEEQRFGVAQKERLKELAPHVDVLTLSATPIPRTLNMAMSGLRDMSSLDEAPQDRHPVQTYVLEYDAGVLLDAMRRELRRGGQVYYLHNRVESIDACAARIQQKLPDAAVGVAHGRMSEEELSEIWRRLIDREIDVLVCTTIIETGVDVPNVNTLIIENADRMGLSQLHQLRGRVGRSARRAYAYLTFRGGRALSEISEKRLEAIREFTEFGSGFKIAMRDLEIRGAGNLLGGEQHGHMDAVGYEMYLRLLSDAVSEERGEPPASDAECTVDLQVQAHIPEDYIESLPARLGVYRRIADIRSEEDASDVLDELIDRFGEPPASVHGLIDVALLRNQAAALGIFEVVQKRDCMLLYPRALDMKRAAALAGALRGRVTVSAGREPYLSVRMKKGQTPLDTLREAIGQMRRDAEASGGGAENAPSRA